MTEVAAESLLRRPEASWVQIIFLVPVRDAKIPAAEIEYVEEHQGLGWVDSVADFPVLNEPGARTDRAWRSRLLASGAVGTLYDGRRHVVLGAPVRLAGLDGGEHPAALEVSQLEFLPTGIRPGFGPGGVLVVHAEVRAGGTAVGDLDPTCRLPLRWLAGVVKDLARPAAGPGRAQGFAEFAGGWGFTLDPDPEIAMAVNLACPDATLRALRPVPDGPGGGSPLEVWAWALARGTVPTVTMLHGSVPPAGPARRVAMPHHTAVVDRSGVAVVGTMPVDTDRNIARTLAEFVPIFQSVYTDVLLLGYLELLVATEVGARLDGLDDPVRRPREFHEIELRMRFLHDRVWRNRISAWPWLRELLAAFREQNAMPETVSWLSGNIRDFGAQIDRGAQQRLNLVILVLSGLGLLGVVAGILGAVAAFMAVFGTGHWGAVVGIVATGVAAVVLGVVGVLLVRGRLRRS